jgi:hypothetical protein
MILTEIPKEEIRKLLKLERVYLKSVLKALGKKRRPSLDLDKCPPCTRSRFMETQYDVPSCMICTSAGNKYYNMADRCVILTGMIYYKDDYEIRDLKKKVKEYIKMIERDLHF